jgi:hypothetical protein
MGILEQNLEMDFGPEPDDALKSAFNAHDFPCAAALINAGVRICEDGIDLQELVIGLEDGKPLDAGAANMISKGIYRAFLKHDICESPFARNAVNSLCRQGLNMAIGETTGLAAMAKALLQGSFQSQGVDDLVETVLEAYQDDLLDSPDEVHIDLFFKQLKAFDPEGAASKPLAQYLVKKYFSDFDIWGERPRADSYSKPSTDLMKSMTLILGTKIETAGEFKRCLAAALNQELDPGCILLDLIAFSKKHWTGMQWQRFQSSAQEIINNNLSMDEISEMVATDTHLSTLNSLGFETDSLNKSMLRPSVLESVFEAELGL